MRFALVVREVARALADKKGKWCNDVLVLKSGKVTFQTVRAAQTDSTVLIPSCWWIIGMKSGSLDLALMLCWACHWYTYKSTVPVCEMVWRWKRGNCMLFCRFFPTSRNTISTLYNIYPTHGWSGILPNRQHVLGAFGRKSLRRAPTNNKSIFWG